MEGNIKRLDKHNDSPAHRVLDLALKAGRILLSRGAEIFRVEETIEYIVRCTIINYLHKYGGRTVPYIVIVDHGSTDKTKEIAQKLCDDYDFLFFTTSQQYEEFKKEMEARENL